MKVFIQLATDARDPECASRQRVAFFDYVKSSGDLKRDRIILVEPNPHLAQMLRSLWSEAGNVEIHPDLDLGSIERRYTSTSNVLAHQDPAREIDIVAMDPSALGMRESLESRPSSSGIHDLLAGAHKVALSFNSLISPESRRAAITGVRQGGEFSPAGRAWGEAGESALLIHPRTTSEALHAAAQEFKVALGRMIVNIRDGLFGQSTRFGIRTFVHQLKHLDLRGVNVLDRSGRSGLPPVPRWEVVEALDGVDPSVVPSDLPTWSAPGSLAEDPWDVSQECYASHGVWPLSFSFPREPLAINPQPGVLVSPITPGHGYSFHDERMYMETYANAYWGLTHRKAGWDCFRHVEILASGALPWMLDADGIPRFSMVHYPKVAMASAAARLRRGACVPDSGSRERFRDYFREHLTSMTMARYLLKAAGQESCRSVLFVDERLPGHADYQSVLTLIGLKQLLGPRCQVMFPVDYVYENSRVASEDLYGRGFGYTRVLAPDLRSDSELGVRPPDLASVDMVVVGSISRNAELGREVLKHTDPSRVAWIHGEDLPPTIDEVRSFRASGVHVFVRSIHVGG